MITNHSPPPPGIWLRPIGRGRWYAYCLRVVRVFPPDSRDSLECVQCERWGLDRAAQIPVRDAHADHSWHRGLRKVLPGVWRAPIWYQTGPLYYRAMTTGPRGQIDLFA